MQGAVIMPVWLECEYCGKRYYTANNRCTEKDRECPDCGGQLRKSSKNSKNINIKGADEEKEVYFEVDVKALNEVRK